MGRPRLGGLAVLGADRAVQREEGAARHDAHRHQVVRHVVPLAAGQGPTTLTMKWLSDEIMRGNSLKGGGGLSVLLYVICHPPDCPHSVPGTCCKEYDRRHPPPPLMAKPQIMTGIILAHLPNVCTGNDTYLSASCQGRSRLPPSSSTADSQGTSGAAAAAAAALVVHHEQHVREGVGRPRLVLAGGGHHVAGRHRGVLVDGRHGGHRRLQHRRAPGSFTTCARTQIGRVGALMPCLQGECSRRRGVV